MRSQGSKRKASQITGAMGLTSAGNLSSVLRAVGDLNVDVRHGFNTESLTQALQAEFDHLFETVPLKFAEKEGEYQWELLEPNKLLAHVLESCPELAECYGRAANERPPTPEDPWDLLICFDEFVPGDKLKPHNSRKAMVLGFNFRQLGPEVSTQMYPIIFC